MSGPLLLAAAAAWLAAAVIGLGSFHKLPLAASAGLSAAGGSACSAGGVLLGLGGAKRPGPLNLSAPSSLVGSLDLRGTALAATFLVLLGLAALAIGLYSPRYHAPSRATGLYLCVYNFALLASLAVLLAGNLTTFLVAWESMTLTCGLLVLRYQSRPGVARGAFLFLGLGEIGFLMIVAAFAILAAQSHSADLAVIASRTESIPPSWRDAAFVLALFGFGFKAGLVPLHLWLPAAHPVAPSDGSAFLSGLIIKLGIYGIALFAFELLRDGAPAWWGLLTMALGALSAVIGVLYALVERDIKRFLAYSSVENVGIITTAIGAGITFRAYGRDVLGAFLLLVALYHVLNHGVAKILLFLEAGVIEHSTGTRDLDNLGGLVHRLRATAVITLVGTLALAALPPLNGFVSEWLVFQGLFQSFRIPSHLVAALLVLAAAVLGLTGGLAILAFTRTFGISFLGMPRTQGAADAKEKGQPLLGPGLMAAACASLAVGAPAVLVGLSRVTTAVTGIDLRPTLLISNLTVIPAHTDFAAFSPTYLAVFIVGVSVVPLAIFLASRPRAATARVPVWDGGIVVFKPRMQYNASTFANPVRVTFQRFYQPEVHIDRASDDPAGRSGPVHYTRRVTDVFERYLYRPVVRTLQRLSELIQPLQSGDVNLYLLYILLVVVVAFLVYAY